MAEAKAETNDALENLRDLARGIYPPLLADQGPRRRPRVRRRGRPRSPWRSIRTGSAAIPQETEAAVYFSCLEALQNVAKYAEASTATVRLAQSNGSLTFEVADDGVGFDPEAAERGSGTPGDRRPARRARRPPRGAERAGERHDVIGTLPAEGGP